MIRLKVKAWGSWYEIEDPSYTEVGFYPALQGRYRYLEDEAFSDWQHSGLFYFEHLSEIVDSTLVAA